MADSRPDPDDESWTSYAPADPSPNAGVCSWCGQHQGPEVLVVMNREGSAGICEECVDGHARFFARRHAEPG